MGKAPTSTAAKPETQGDEMPPLDDDIEVAEAAPAPSEDDGDFSAPTRGRDVEKPETPREMAVRLYREKRDREMRAAQGETDDTADDGEDATDETPPVAAAAPKVAAPAAAPAPQAAADEPTYTLIVDGKPVTLKASEVVAKAQIAVASDNRLEEAKRLLQEARALRGRPADDPEHQPDDDGDLNAQDDPVPRGKTASPNQADTEIDPDKLADIVERIQIGDKDEGKQALSELVSLVRQSNAGMKPDEIGRVVNEQLARASVKSEIETAVKSFEDAYPALVKDEELLDTAFSRLRTELRQDLVQAGLPSEKLAMMTGQQLLELHTGVRMKGAKVRDYRSMFDKVGQDMTQRYGAVLAPAASRTGTTPQPTQPAPSPLIAERIERKRTSAPQPRTAGVRAAPQPQQRPKTKAEVIAEMRRSRGFSA